MELRDSLPSIGHSERERVDVWLLSTKIDAEQRAFYQRVLSTDERERAGRFRFPTDQDRFIVGRGGLRWILSECMDVDGAKLLFRTGSHGKPFLVDYNSHVEFNVSHAGDCVLIGITQDAQCGVDIELPHPRVPELEIAERFFCSREVEWMSRTKIGFTRLWTMKEAVMKAVGWGLSIPLNAIDMVDVAEGRTSKVVLEGAGLEPHELCLQELNLLKGYAASVAVVGRERAVAIMPN